MISTKPNGEKLLKLFPVVMRPAIPDTLESIPVGSTARFRCSEIGTLNSVRAAATRLNHKYGRRAFSVTYVNNGELIDVRRTAGRRAVKGWRSWL